MLRILIAFVMVGMGQSVTVATAQSDWKPDAEKFQQWDVADQAALGFCVMAFGEGPYLPICATLEEQVNTGVDVQPLPGVTAKQKCEAAYSNPSHPDSIACQMRALFADENFRKKGQG